jgi:hypothetical protein
VRFSPTDWKGFDGLEMGLDGTRARRLDTIGGNKTARCVRCEECKADEANKRQERDEREEKKDERREWRSGNKAGEGTRVLFPS